MQCFEKYLSLWVLLCMVGGGALGYGVPSIAESLREAEIEKISIPMAILLWIMLFPVLLGIDYSAIRNVRKEPAALLVTTITNYCFQPFLMFGLSVLFFKVIFAGVIDNDSLQDQYVGGSVILGAAPCTAMVFTWSLLVKGDPVYTLTQVAVNDLIMVAAYAPTVMLLLGVTSLPMPWETVLLSIAIYVVVPGIAAYITRKCLIRKGGEPLVLKVKKHMTPVAIVGLLLTLVLIFIFQGANAIENWTHVLLILVPLTLQTLLVFMVAYGFMWVFRVPFRYAAPGALIATSNFFELAAALASSLYGLESGATLATTVGVLEEVPLMLFLVWVCNRTKSWIDRRHRREGTDADEANKESKTPAEDPNVAIELPGTTHSTSLMNHPANAI